MPRVAKNDNLVKYKQKQIEINTSLIRRAIEHIQKLNGDVNFSLVSKVTYDIADASKGEKGISLAGISKSKIYRPMIEKAKLSNGLNSNSSNNSKMHLSVGDMQMSFHSMRVENAKLKMENKILKQTIKERETPKSEMKNIDADLIKQHTEMKQVCSSLVSRLLELELTYIDADKSTLNVAMYDDVVVSKESLELFFKKELDALKS